MSKQLETMLRRLPEERRAEFLELWDRSGEMFKAAAGLRRDAFRLYAAHRLDTKPVTDAGSKRCNDEFPM